MTGGLRLGSFTFILVALLLTGCRDMGDVNQRILVYALGLDDADGEEVEVTVHYLQTDAARSGGGSQGQSDSSFAPINHIAQGRSVSMAMQKISGEVPGRLFLGSVRLILIGERLARSGFGAVLDALIRTPLLPVAASTAVVSGTAKELLETASLDATTPAIHIVNALANAERYAGGVADVPLYRLHDQAFRPHYTDLIPVFESARTGPRVAGIGILSRDRLVHIGKFPGSALLMAIEGGATLYFELLPTNEWDIPPVFQFHSIRVRPSFDRAQGRVAVSVQGAGYLVEWPARAANADEGTQETRRAVMAELNTAVTRRLEDLVIPLYRQGVDIFNIAELERRRTGRFPEDWQDQLPQLTIDIETHITLLHGERGSMPLDTGDAF